MDKIDFIIVVVMIIVILILTFFGLTIIGDNFFEDGFCDYDSCSQKASLLFDRNTRCFNNNNSECKLFLEFWNECQELKKEGEC